MSHNYIQQVNGVITGGYKYNVFTFVCRGLYISVCVCKLVHSVLSPHKLNSWQK